MRWLVAALCLTLVACGNGSDLLSHQGICDGYVTSTSSPYKLPYAVGDAHIVAQSNCSPLSHFGANRYAYDFDMPIGTNIVAARAGTVIEVVKDNTDGNGCPNDNHVKIRHADGTVAIYVHLTENGASVNVNDSVTQGQTIGRSGNTGCSSGPHMHFMVGTDEDFRNTVPVTFSNTTAHRWALKAGQTYTAQ